MLDRIIRLSFYILFFLTPLFFTKFNSELFEFNKMILVYTLTVIITGVWIIKMVNHKSFIVYRTPLDIPLMLFLLSQILSTIFSIDRHTSIWGYYSRSNGGLLSIISYILLFYAFVSNTTKDQVLRFLKAALFGGLIVSLWAIPEHFGFSPSCAILVQRFTADCWVQNVQDRVFATLGQPNWLAAYLGMLIFPSIYFITQAKTLASKTTYYMLLAAYYLAFTFTYSRGGSIGFLVGFGVVMLFWLVHNRFWSFSGFAGPDPQKDGFTKPFLLVTCILLLINLFFGSALTGDFKLIKRQASPARPGISLAGASSGGGTQLENGGSESGQIRLIVWKGALDIFKHYPIFGSGVETFAYSYYQFKPIEHNLTSEWDFLYNKAHNEFINYLATTGIVGFLSYMGIIVVFIGWSIKYYVLRITQKKHNTSYILFTSSLLAGYITYLVQNFFGFSVVMIAVLFYLFPAFVFVYTESLKPLILPKFIIHYSLFINLIYRRSLYTHIFRIFLICLILSGIFRIIQNWSADSLYKYGSEYSDAGNPGRAYNYLASAVNLNPKEPLYRSELGFAAASATVALADEDSTTSAKLKKQAVEQTEKALRIGPKNVSLYRTAIRTYYQLSEVDLEYEEKSVNIMDKAISLAPTDPKLYHNKGLILSQTGKFDEAIEAFRKAVELRPIYQEAYLALGKTYKELKKKEEALGSFKKALELNPLDEEASKEMEELKEK